MCLPFAVPGGSVGLGSGSQVCVCCIYIDMKVMTVVLEQEKLQKDEAQVFIAERNKCQI